MIPEGEALKMLEDQLDGSLTERKYYLGQYSRINVKREVVSTTDGEDFHFSGSVYYTRRRERIELRYMFLASISIELVDLEDRLRLVLNNMSTEMGIVVRNGISYAEIDFASVEITDAVNIIIKDNTQNGVLNANRFQIVAIESDGYGTTGDYNMVVREVKIPGYSC